MVELMELSRMASSRDCCFETRSLPINACNRQELISLEARAADQRAVDVGNAHELRGIGGLHRAAVEDAHPLPRLAVTRDQLPADEPVHLGNVGRRRREAAADGP